jgi:hypothetical protein
MKIWIALFVASVSVAGAAELQVKNPRAEYVVSHLVKTVKGVSTQMKGKMVCNDGQCQFLVAIPAKSFVSSDSNRDSNMQTILEVAQYPLITVKGQLAEADLKKEKFDLTAKVLFHGVEKDYKLGIENKNGFSGMLTLRLEDHKVERPSLLTVSIDNEVPVHFSLNWVE